MYKMVIVEDEHLIRRWLTCALNYEEMGIKLVGDASDGQAGAQLIRIKQPDIVITDINMPVMNAFDMFDQTSDLAYKKIILSGYNDFENAKRAIHYQVQEFLAKPLVTEELRLNLVEILTELDARQQLTINQLTNQLIPERSPVTEEVTKQVLRWLHGHYADKFTVAELASELGYSESYVYKRFKDCYEITINEYLNRYRIKQAITILTSQPDVMIYEVAEQVGFADYKYFNKVFKKVIGVSVTEFRENIL